MSEIGHSLRGRPGGKSGHAPLHAPSVLSAKEIRSVAKAAALGCIENTVPVYELHRGGNAKAA